ncbi:MAG: MFS transporter [Tannerellaceae bacterium]
MPKGTNFLTTAFAATPNDASLSNVRLWTPAYMFAFFSYFMLFISYYILIPTLPFYLTMHLGESGTTAGIILSLFNMVSLLCRPISGYVIDLFSRKPMYLACYALFTIICAGYMFSSLIIIFILLRILHGAMFSFTTVSANTLAVDILPESRRGEGIGYFGMATNLGMAVGPIIGLDLMNNYNFCFIFGFAFAACMLGLFAIMLIKKSAIPAKKREASPSLKASLILRRGVWGATAFFFIAISYGVMTNYISLYSKSIGIHEATGFFFSMLAAGLVIGRIACAKVINKGTINTVIYTGIIILLIALGLFLQLLDLTTFYICAFLFGLAYGFITPAFQTMFVRMADDNQRGTANSTYFTAWDCGLGLGVALGGSFIEHYNYNTLFVFCICTVVVGLILFTIKAAPYYSVYMLLKNKR